MKLEEKQEAFEYRSPKDLYVHGEPFSPSKWNEELTKIGGRCPFGDPRLRIVWGGTATKRGYVQTDARSEERMIIKYPAPVSKVRILVGFIWYDGNGSSFAVERSDQIPKGKLSLPYYEYHQLGALRWVFERKFTPDELVAMQMYPDPRSPQAKTFGVRGSRRYVAAMDPRGEYIGLYPLQTPEGKYFEPTEGWFELLRKTEKEAKEISEGEKSMMLNSLMDALDNQERRKEAAQKEMEDAIFEDALIEAEKVPQGRVIFT